MTRLCGMAFLLTLNYFGCERGRFVHSSWIASNRDTLYMMIYFTLVLRLQLSKNHCHCEIWLDNASGLSRCSGMLLQGDDEAAPYTIKTHRDCKGS
jgi:hypothetical protein